MRSNNLTHVVIGAAMKVHNALGSHHAEIVYHRAALNVLRERGLEVADRPTLVVRMDGRPVAEYYPDCIARRGEEVLIVDFKAEREIRQSDLRQMQAYLSAYKGEARGLIVNFGTTRLTWEVVQRENHIARRRYV